MFPQFSRTVVDYKIKINNRRSSVVVVMVLLGNHNERVLIVIQHSGMFFRACRLVRSDTRSLRSTFKEHDEASIVFDKRSGRQWPFISNTKTESKKKNALLFPRAAVAPLYQVSIVCRQLALLTLLWVWGADSEFCTVCSAVAIAA